MTDPLKVMFVQADDGDMRDTYYNSAPLGIHRMRKFLEARFENKIDVTCFDPNLYDNSRTTLNDKLRERQFDIVGYSPLHDTLARDMGHMLDAVEILPNAIHIAGGQQAGLSRELLFPYIPHLNLIARGDGEKPMTGLVERVLQHGVAKVREDPMKYLLDVRGFYVREGTSNDSIFTEHAVPFTREEFAKITSAVDFTDVNLTSYFDQLRAHYTDEQLQDPELLGKLLTAKPYTSNYCPKGCTFCSTTYYHRDAMGNPAKITAMNKEELSTYARDLLLKNPEVRKVMFKDDLWFLRGIPESELIDVLGGLGRVRDEIKRLDGRDITYHGKARVDTFVNPKTLEIYTDLLTATRNAGFKGVSIGAESYNVDELKSYGKKLGEKGPEVNRIALQACRDHGIGVVSYMILSGLYSTPTSLVDSVRGITNELKRGGIVRINDKLFSLPGTKIADDLKKSGEDLAMKEESAVFGHEHIKVSRIVSIAPKDQEARSVVDDYTERLPKSKKKWQERLEISHWIPEVEGPHKMHVMNTILTERGHFSREDGAERKKDLESMLMNYLKSGKEVSKEQTSA